MDRSLSAGGFPPPLATCPAWVRSSVLLSGTESTNDEVRQLARHRAPEGTVVIADQQSSGRGRAGRSWFSAPGLGLYLSLLLRPQAPVEQLTRWTLAAAVAACRACRQLTGQPVEISWPNDLVFGSRKLGGILTESRLRAGGNELIIGLGINVRHREDDFPAELRSIATSLHLVAGCANLERGRLACDYLDQMGEIHQQLKANRWKEVARCWEELAPAARGTPVRVSPGPGGQAYEGITDGLDHDGALLVRRADGQPVAVRMADAVSFIARDTG